MVDRDRRATVSEGATSVALAATVHDPDGRFVPHLRRAGGDLERYAAVSVAATVTTAPEVREALGARGAFVSPVAPGAVGEARRVALRHAALDRAGAVLSCDFDRWLHWAGVHPDELRSLPDRIGVLAPDPWYVCLGRSARAFATHPRVQREAEAATNRALELVLGCAVDAVAGASWLSSAGRDLILARSIEATNATDLEWPALIHAAAPARLRALFLEGLEFETASFYVDEIARMGGHEAWMRATYEHPSVWGARLRLAADSVAALVRVRDVSS